MTTEMAKAILMIFLFGSLCSAIHLSESIATKRLRALALQVLRRAHPRRAQNRDLRAPPRGGFGPCC